jgi:hypothetical protein
MQKPSGGGGAGDYANPVTAEADPMTQLPDRPPPGRRAWFLNLPVKIDGETVVVSSPAVPKPAVVRYAWGSINHRTWAVLFNRDRFPAVTFRTDDRSE